jgi:hypothetical protein
MDLSDAHQLCFLAIVAILTIVVYVRCPSRIRPSAAVERPSIGRKTFRVLGVPPAWDEARLLSFLTDPDSSVGPHIWSLASEVNGPSSTATVSFQKVLSPLRKPSSGNSTGNSWQLRVEASRHRLSLLTMAFSGLLRSTLLQRTTNRVSTRADLNAVHMLTT